MALVEFSRQICKEKPRAELGSLWNFPLLGILILSNGHVALIKEIVKGIQAF